MAFSWHSAEWICRTSKKGEAAEEEREKVFPRDTSFSSSCDGVQLTWNGVPWPGGGLSGLH